MFCFHRKVFLRKKKEKTTVFSWKESKNQIFWHIVKGCTVGRTVKNKSVLSKNPSAGVSYAHTLPWMEWGETMREISAVPWNSERTAWVANQSGKGCTEELWSDDYMIWACFPINPHSIVSWVGPYSSCSKGQKEMEVSVLPSPIVI